MKNVVLYLLGKKGLNVAKAALCSEFSCCIVGVVVGRDKNVINDYSEDIFELCKKLSIKAWERNEDDSQQLHAEDYFAIAAGWRWFIKKKYKQIIVFHDSLLPKYRGFNPLVSALINKENIVGVTAIIANNEYDRGDIISSKSVAISYPIKISDAIDLVCDLYYELTVDILSLIVKEAFLNGFTQDEAKATYSLWRDEEDYRIDWTQSSYDILHFINCVGAPYKGASSILDQRIIRIHSAELCNDVVISNRVVGKIIFIIDGFPVLVCGNGLLKITEVKFDDGTSVLPVKSFRTRLK